MSVLLATSTATTDRLPSLDALEHALEGDTLYPLDNDVGQQQWIVTSRENVWLQAEAEVDTQLSSTTTQADRLAILRAFMDRDHAGQNEQQSTMLRTFLDVSNSFGTSSDIEHIEYEMFRRFSEEDEDVHRERAAREAYEAMEWRAELQIRLWEQLQARRWERFHVRKQKAKAYVPPSMFEDEHWVLALLTQYTFETHVRRRSFVVDPNRTNEACPICFEPYGTSNATTCVFGQCGHHLCSECMYEDYATRTLNSCALCRQPLFAPPKSGVTLRELVAFAYDFGLEFVEFDQWPYKSAYGRYATRWFYAAVGARQSTQWWPRNGPWKGSRAHTAQLKRRCVG